MGPLAIIKKYYDPQPEAKAFLVEHSRQVARKALEVAMRVRHLGPDVRFVEEAAMLHDIGIFRTDAPPLGCHGGHPYICHGVIGRALLEAEGMPLHALVCERHVGVGLTVEDIRKNNFTCLPERDMTPQTLEEKIVCFADKFFSKVGDPLAEKPLEEVRSQIEGYGPEKLALFDKWAAMFEEK
jgi:uncharacterized protein